ncbi:protein TolQ [Coralloluteibacterium thermophilus]|uniref:Tol-Pal system protein TolQ n=1 Tax=Coralloluteibacterium thermophilum TaxID=2707049 RepID=A0ABV9NMJ7_9GAMM
MAFPEAAASVAAASGGLNYLELILHASIPVQLVMLILLAASVASWVIIFRKRKVFIRAFDEAEDFEDKFWSGVDLAQLYRNASERNREVHGMEAIFEAGFREFGRLSKKRTVDSRTQLEGAQRAMRAQLSREVDALEQNVELLASIGSVSPYVGLFGTVWGIMISFHSLASMREATIATVAPGISEALIATAMGLFAAIPAVVAYNRYATKVERLAVRYEAFAEEFSSILQRQAHLDDE